MIDMEKVRVKTDRHGQREKKKGKTWKKREKELIHIVEEIERLNNWVYLERRERELKKS